MSRAATTRTPTPLATPSVPSIVLIRYSLAPYGTYGAMYLGSTRLYTVEQPWRMNERMRSCIPVGDYKIINHNSAKFPNTFALINHDLDVYYQDGAGVPSRARKAILIHPANIPEDLAGCIAPGMAMMYTRNNVGVSDSRTAMQMVRDYIKANRITRLKIRNVDTNQSVDAISTYAKALSR